MVRKILFVCHGNICRSPLAEFVMKHLAANAGCLERFEIASGATSREELGNPVYPPVRELMKKYNIPFSGHRARQINRSDYEYYDLIVVMDKRNIANMRRLVGDDERGKVHLLMEYAGKPESEVADPWYSGNFEETWRDVYSGCKGLLAQELNLK